MTAAMLLSRPSASSRDRRALRSREAILRAGIELVQERDSVELSISDIAERAGVSRQVVYLHYRDRNQVLIDAAVDLFTRDLIHNFRALPESMFQDVLLLTRHFDDNRDFYRVMLGGPCSYELNRQLFMLLQPFNGETVRFLLGDDVDDDMVESLSAFLTGGFEQLISLWITSRQPGLPGPEEFAHHLTRVLQVLSRNHGKSTSPLTDNEIDQ